MAGHQQDEVASAAATKAARNAESSLPKRDTILDRQIQNRLEDDNVREALRLPCRAAGARRTGKTVIS
jgi:hypothetical protein